VVNGSMGFDEATLDPHFALSLGLRAKSPASKSLHGSGMPEAIMSAPASP